MTSLDEQARTQQHNIGKAILLKYAAETEKFKAEARKFTVEADRLELELKSEIKAAIGSEKS